MKAAVHRAHGGSEVIELLDVPEVAPGPSDVVVDVRAAGLNRLDILQRQGPALLPGFQLPHIAGMDVAGEVVEVGPEVSSVAVGDRVLVNPAITCGECLECRAGNDAYCAAGSVVGGNRPGGFAERCTVPAANVHTIPDGVGFAEAATIPTIYSTAWRALFPVGDLRLGEVVVIHAAGSGVSTAAIQLAKRAGATVVATAGSDAKLDMAAKLGADACVNNRSDRWVQEVRDVTAGRGVDMVFDHVGPALFQGSLETLRPRGRLVFCGATTGVSATFRLPRAYQLGLRLLGADSYSRREFAEMLDYYWSGGFEPVIHAELPLEQLGAAQDELESGAAIGKVLVRPRAT
jgi:NADPH:quinone reductase-like Zn-dependent oxidoreductase